MTLPHKECCVVCLPTRPKISPRAHAVAGKDAEAHEGLVVLVTFFDGAVLYTTVPFCTQLRFGFADFDAYTDIVATF